MIAAIIQARMGSTRLPGKILEDIEGKSMLAHVVERVGRASSVEKVIIATTTNPEDDIIEELAQKEGWEYYRGSDRDVLDRYYQAAKKFNVTTVVRLTSDCPLSDPELIDRCVQVSMKGGYDYVSNCLYDCLTYPRGLDVSVISLAALEKCHQEAKKNFEREHVVAYIWHHQNKFRIGPLVTAPADYERNYRFTVDYPEDLELIRIIYRRLYRLGSPVSVKSAIALLDQNPEIASINKMKEQKPYEK